MHISGGGTEIRGEKTVGERSSTLESSDMYGGLRPYVVALRDLADCSPTCFACMTMWWVNTQPCSGLGTEHMLVFRAWHKQQKQELSKHGLHWKPGSSTVTGDSEQKRALACTVLSSLCLPSVLCPLLCLLCCALCAVPPVLTLEAQLALSFPLILLLLLISLIISFLL